MTLHETLMQGVRSWLKFAASLTDEQVLANDYAGARPALPYLEVRVDRPDETVGTDEALTDTDPATGQARVRVRGQRRAVVTVRGFGDETMEWLALAAASLFNPIALAYLDELGLSLRTLGPSVKTSPRVDTRREAQITRDFELSYAIETDPQDVPELERVEADVVLEHDEDDPDGQTVTIIAED